MRLFCLPYAGRGASTFREWQREAPPWLDICAIQLPGRENRWTEEPFSRIEPLVRALCDDLASYFEPPFALFGCSMGALIAFELARALTPRDRTPSHLFAAARRAPGRPESCPPCHHLSDEEFVRQLGAYAGTPREILESPEVMSVYLPSIRADFALCERYVYGGGDTLACPVTVFGGRQDPHVSMDDLAAWQSVTSSSFGLRTFDGGHFFVHDNRTALLEAITTELGRHARFAEEPHRLRARASRPVHAPRLRSV
jgi:medium-chain acyl-[acyl-carrier-protein] hydrolase